MNIKNIAKAANLSDSLNERNNLIELLENKDEPVLINFKHHHGITFNLNSEMRQALLEIARKDKESIIKQIEDL